MCGVSLGMYGFFFSIERKNKNSIPFNSIQFNSNPFSGQSFCPLSSGAGRLHELVKVPVTQV
jgi:hypothetical protein